MMNDVDLKFAENLIVGLSYATLAAFFTWLHSVQFAGHKRDLTVSASFFVAIAMSRFAGAWQAIYGPSWPTRTIEVLAIGAAVAIMAYIPYRFRDAAKTLLRSEYVQRILMNKMGDDEMEAELLQFAAHQTQANSQKILDRWNRRHAESGVL